MKLKDLLKVIDIYQNFQLMNAKTGQCLTSVTYMEGGSEGDSIELYSDWYVHGISASNTENKEEPFVLITLNSR